MPGFAGFDVRREPDGVRRSIGVTGQFSAIDELLTGRENLRLMADLAHLRRVEARARVEELMVERGRSGWVKIERVEQRLTDSHL